MTMAKGDQDVEKHVSRGTLEKLLKAADRCNSAIGSAREEYGQAVEKAKGLNKFAFGVVQKLYKKDPAQAAKDIRALNLYIEQLGLDAQGDLEDAINDAEAAEEEEEGGDGDDPNGSNVTRLHH